MLAPSGEGLVNQYRRCLISDGAINVVSTANDAAINNFSVDVVVYGVWPPPQARERIHRARKN